MQSGEGGNSMQHGRAQPHDFLDACCLYRASEETKHLRHVLRLRREAQALLLTTSLASHGHG